MSRLWSIVGNWLGGISLRAKIVASIAASVLSVIAYLFARYRVASMQADRSGARADALQRARNSELAILARRASANRRIEAMREEVRKRKERDFFEGGYKR